MSSALPGSSGHGTAPASPQGHEKGGHKTPALSPSLAQHCSSDASNNQQKIMALRFSFLLHVLLKDLVGGKKREKKRKDAKEALGPLETSAPSQCCSAQAKHLSLNDA